MNKLDNEITRETDSFSEDYSLTINVSTGSLKACSRVASDDPCRPSLRGVFIEADRKGTTIVGTNGCCLLVVRCRGGRRNNIDAPISLFIPRGVVAKAVKGLRRNLHCVLKYKSDKKSWEIFVPHLERRARVEFAPKKVNFGDWRWIIPNNASGVFGRYSPGHIAAFERAAEDIADRERGESPLTTIFQNGACAPAVVVADRRLVGDFLGVMMPLKIYDGEAAAWKPPLWLGLSRDSKHSENNGTDTSNVGEL